MRQKEQPSPTQIVFRELDSLVPYARNTRTHSEDQVRQIAASMLEFGWTFPVLGDKDGIVAGHGKCLAARLIYDSGKSIKLPNGETIPDGMAPFLDCTGWTKAQRKAYVIADNKIALNSGFDFELLAVELDDLRDEGFNLALTGFAQDELADLIGDPNSGMGDSDGEGSGDGADDSTSAISKPGDVWLIGPHRLTCGKSKLQLADELLMLFQQAHDDVPIKHEASGKTFAQVSEARAA